MRRMRVGIPTKRLHKCAGLEEVKPRTLRRPALLLAAILASCGEARRSARARGGKTGDRHSSGVPDDRGGRCAIAKKRSSPSRAILKRTGAPATTSRSIASGCLQTPAAVSVCGVEIFGRRRHSVSDVRRAAAGCRADVRGLDLVSTPFVPFLAKRADPR